MDNKHIANKHIKILASDYDGTLSMNDIITKEDMTFIEKWREAGNLFGLITGRSFCDASYELKRRNIEYDFLICNNGSAIYNSKDECIDLITGNNIVLKSLVRHIVDFKGDRAAISGINDRLSVFIKKDHNSPVPEPMPESCRSISRPALSSSSQDAKYPRQDYDHRFRDRAINDKNEKLIKFEEIDSITFPFTQVDTNALTDENAERLAEKINTDKELSEYVHAHINGINVDITPKGVHKTSGIYRLMSKFNIKKENVYVIGDNLNDLEMIIEFNGFAVSSGNPVVISNARKIYSCVGDLIQDYL